MILENVNYTTERACAQKHVSGSEPFALGHYPGSPIYPGVQTLQMMLDLGRGLLIHRGHAAPTRTCIVRTQYLDMVRPGDVLAIEAEVGKNSAERVRIAARVSAGGVVKARGTFDYEFCKE